MENEVRGRARTAGANSRRGATKKREISQFSHNLLSINLNFSVQSRGPSPSVSYALFDPL